MLIPNKFSGFHNGVRRCFGSGGGGGGAGGDGGTGDAASAAGGAVGPGASGTGNGSGDGGGSGPGPGGPNNVYTPNYSNTSGTGFNPNRGNVTGMNFGNTNTAGTSTIPRNNLNLQNMYGTPYNQSGQQYNALLQQGFTGNDIRNSLTTQGRPVSDSDYGYLVQDAGMKSPTGRPYAGSDQFFQPVYNSQYQNYARPATQFNVSSYGTQPSNSPAFNSGMSRGAINQNLNNFYNTNYRDNPQGASMGSTLDFMRQKGINRDDFQSWGGVNNYGPQMSMPQMQSPFNPYSNSSGQGGVLTPYSGGRPTDVTGGDYMGGKGTGMPFAQRMGQLGIPAGLDDTMTPGIMAANAANQQKNAASRANTAANPASISDLSKRLGLMGGYGGNTSPQGMLTNRLEQPQGMRQIPQEMIEANKKAAALTALEAPTNYSAEYMRNMMKSPQGGGDYTGRGSFGNDMREAGPMGGGMDQLAVMPQQGEGGPDVNSPYFAGVGAMQKNNDALVAANRPPTFSDYGGPMGMMPQQSGFLPQMQNPFSFQQQSYQQQYNPYQMQLPFSYQHPLLGNGPKPVAQPAIPPNYGPTSPIISRSAGFRGTPNVMRRAEGGIASLMDDVE